jgi:hypothetical protein
MEGINVLGVMVVVVAGLLMGSGAWPIKLMHSFRYEHFAFIAMFIGLFLLPWAITFTFCPNALQAYKALDFLILLKSNLFSLCWGVANVLGLMCMVRIGFCLTNGILAGLGVSIGVIVPLIFKASGLFEKAADLNSKAGLTVVGGVVVMLLGVVMVSWAGFGRDKILQKTERTTGSFLVGLIMVIVAGITSCGISFAFVYSQGPITAAMKQQGAGEIPANFAVWAVGLLGGACVNILYPAYLMTKRKSWHVLVAHPKEVVLAAIIGLNMCLAMTLMGKGMILLGALGASVGFGIQQAMQILGGQAVGFLGGEWKGVRGRPRQLMYLAIVTLVVAAAILSYGNSLAG